MPLCLDYYQVSSVRDLSKGPLFIEQLTAFLRNIDFYFFFLFFIFIVRERFFLWNMIYFQASRAFEELDVQKSAFRMMEQRKNGHFSRAIFYMTTIYIILLLAPFSIYFHDFLIENVAKLLSLYYFILVLIRLVLVCYCLSLTIFSTQLYMKAMKLFQKFEYERHKTQIRIVTLIIMFALCGLVVQMSLLSEYWFCMFRFQRFKLKGFDEAS
jgi:hypothetical protein